MAHVPIRSNATVHALSGMERHKTVHELSAMERYKTAHELSAMAGRAARVQQRPAPAHNALSPTVRREQQPHETLSHQTTATIVAAVASAVPHHAIHTAAPPRQPGASEVRAALPPRAVLAEAQATVPAELLQEVISDGEDKNMT